MEEIEDYDMLKGVNTAWLITFAVLYMKEMLVALVLYLLLFRSLALCPRKNNPTLLSVVFLFFTFLVDLALEIEDLLTLVNITIHSNANCRLLMYTVIGNKILQAMLVLFILYYNCIAGYCKTYKFEVVTVKFYPVVVFALLLIELILVIYPSTTVTMHESGNYCEITSSEGANKLVTWFYYILLPYWFPLLLSLPAIVYMALRYKEGEYIEPRKTQVWLGLSISCSFFILYFLYYILLLGKELESITDHRTEWQKMQGESVWLITRPIFAMIGHGWHIAIPFLCLSQDKELYKHLPSFRGNLSNKKEMKLEDQSPPVPASPVDRSSTNDDGEENNAYINSPATDVVCIG